MAGKTKKTKGRQGAQKGNSRIKSDYVLRYGREALEYEKKHQDIRMKAFVEQKTEFHSLKNEGNHYFALGTYETAIRKYEEALSIFRFIRVKPNGVAFTDGKINCADLEDVDVVGASNLEKQEIKECKVIAYLNIAACLLRLESFKEALAACESALKLEPNNIKAMFRRAKARVYCQDASSYDLSLAQTELAKLERVPNLQTDFQLEIKNLKNDIAVKRKKGLLPYTQSVETGGDDDFADFPKLGPNFEEEVKKWHETRASIPGAQPLWSFEVKKDGELPEEIKQVGKLIEQLRETAESYQKSGRKKEATALFQKIEEAEKSRLQLERVALMDFNSPTPYMRAMAKLFNLDLNDDSFKQELLRMQQSNLEDVRQLISSKKFLTRPDGSGSASGMLVNSVKTAGTSIASMFKGMFASTPTTTSTATPTSTSSQNPFSTTSFTSPSLSSPLNRPKTNTTTTPTIRSCSQKTLEESLDAQTLETLRNAGLLDDSNSPQEFKHSVHRSTPPTSREYRYGKKVKKTSGSNWDFAFVIFFVIAFAAIVFGVVFQSMYSNDF
mmetsp:Transcript_30404/g.34563  ORF Transcript_30404/g.34563 Transcript_30404/m.34563 type:complete len:555 (+) Transcript_30404:7-1671(+)